MLGVAGPRSGLWPGSDRDERRKEAILNNEELAAAEVIAPAKRYGTIVLGLPWPAPSADVIQLRREAEADFDHARRLKAWEPAESRPAKATAPALEPRQPSGIRWRPCWPTRQD
jgi:hypothetical protein